VATVHSTISPEFVDFMARQPVFFVATAPLSRDRHVNLSPKGLESFAVLSPTRVAYLDMTGSGNETAAHLLENGRITFMFCAFEDPPKILRLYGVGTPVMPDDPRWQDLIARFPPLRGVRQIILADIDRVQTSCGFGVPLMQLQSQRTLLTDWAQKKGPEGLALYRQRKNSQSIDGLPTSIPSARLEKGA
jgi:hypothetical protein